MRAANGKLIRAENGNGKTALTVNDDKASVTQLKDRLGFGARRLVSCRPERVNEYKGICRLSDQYPPKRSPTVFAVFGMSGLNDYDNKLQSGTSPAFHKNPG